MGRPVWVITSIVLCLVTGTVGWSIGTKRSGGSKSFVETFIPRPLEKYNIDRLSETVFEDGDIQIEREVKKTDEFNSFVFSMQSHEKKVTGLVNIPNGSGHVPVIIMIRGYVDQEIYQTGMGTNRAGEVFAQSGFITIAPDFLGYGESDQESGNIFETRFQTYTTMLTLLESIKGPSFAEASAGKWDKKNIFIWAHSNGGQIALTVLAITGDEIPTTLWAPVTKPFPYNVLYYTDESSDSGKLIRRELADFEDLYDTDLYSFTNYLDRIRAPIQIHQGTADDAVPLDWTRDFADKLEEKNIDVTYFEYPDADHNLLPSWDTVVRRDLTFFKQKAII